MRETSKDTIELAREAGIAGAQGKTVNGVYKPNVNALGKSVPVEWLETFRTLCEADLMQRLLEEAGEHVAFQGDTGALYYPEFAPHHPCEKLYTAESVAAAVAKRDARITALESQLAKRDELLRDVVLDFLKEYVTAWNDGMAGDSYMLRNARAAITQIETEMGGSNVE